MLTLVGNFNANTLEAPQMSAGVLLAQYYAREAIRIREASSINADLAIAERLLKWLHEEWAESASGNTLISLPDIYQFGPNPINDKATAEKIVRILDGHGWMIPHGQPAVINGKLRREVWKIVSEDN